MRTHGFHHSLRLHRQEAPRTGIGPLKSRSNGTTALLVVLLAGLVLPGCAKKQIGADVPPEELYRQAQDAIEDRRFERAQSLLDAIRDNHPFSKYAVEAELLSADMAYKGKKYEEAAAGYRSFEELHPTNPKVAYAIFNRGKAYFAISLPPDRDQTATRSAAESFQKLLYAYPDSEYGPQAREYLSEVRSRLAGHELYVARFYLRKKKYEAALDRLRGLVQTYPEAPQRDEALRMALTIQETLQGKERSE